MKRIRIITEAAGNNRYSNYVVWAKAPYGPWSKPINLHINGCIDPGHAYDEVTGKRWLFVSGGQVIQLAEDGLSTNESQYRCGSLQKY